MLWREDAIHVSLVLMLLFCLNILHVYADLNQSMKIYEKANCPFTAE